MHIAFTQTWQSCFNILPTLQNRSLKTHPVTIHIPGINSFLAAKETNLVLFFSFSKFHAQNQESLLFSLDVLLSRTSLKGKKGHFGVTWGSNLVSAWIIFFQTTRVKDFLVKHRVQILGVITYIVPKALLPSQSSLGRFISSIYTWNLLAYFDRKQG